MEAPRGYLDSPSVTLSWTIKKAEHQRIDAFELWCWRRLLRVPWTARRSNQAILKEISPDYSLEGLMLKLKLQYFGHLVWRTDSLEKTLMLGKIEGGRRREWQRMRWMASSTQWTWVWASSGSWWWTGKLGMLQSMGLQRVRHNWATELNWVSLQWATWKRESVSHSAMSTLCNPKDCSPPGSYVHRVLQTRIPEWVAMSFLACVFQHLDSSLGTTSRGRSW